MRIGRFVYFFVRAFRAAKWRFLDSVSTGYYRLVCRQVGLGTSIGWGTWILKPWLVSIGSNVYIARDVKITTESDSLLLIEDFVHINTSVDIDYTGGGVISNSVLISEGVRIYSHSHGRDPRSTPIPYGKHIGKNVWIGAGCILMHGCESIGDGAIVGAGAVVSRSISEGKIIVPERVREIN